ncbi:PREDICTED: elongation factor 1-delta 1-like isoform X1 [Nicotiana attenuata]|uniref:Elongation factor 1-delta 1 n=1 Tax=Nicotiana attenuata TaxID=49451 RepID=A0A1J6J1Y0_NICAT|nr:PREDICTED: elongation factor 1-delta 1-like isoform X1 [Nicotiana attenuata]OIT04971.1 elongation factor 1-delta 1 [Nicotiana attenuata]
MAVAFYNLNSDSGLKKLDEYLLTCSYITGYQASKDDITVYSSLGKLLSSEYINASRWYKHIDALLRISGVSGEGSGVKVEGSTPITEPVTTPPAADAKATAAEDEDDDDVDLFGDETEEEKNAAEERAAALKDSGKKKESGKSSIILDVKPWDDETDMKKLEEAVRTVQMEGLFWGASKLVPVGYGIKKLKIILTVDDLESIFDLVENYLTVEPINEYVQSCHIVDFI